MKIKIGIVLAALVISVFISMFWTPLLTCFTLILYTTPQNSSTLLIMYLYKFPAHSAVSILKKTIAAQN